MLLFNLHRRLHISIHFPLVPPSTFHPMNKQLPMNACWPCKPLWYAEGVYMCASACAHVCVYVRILHTLKIQDGKEYATCLFPACFWILVCESYVFHQKASYGWYFLHYAKLLYIPHFGCLWIYTIFLRIIKINIASLEMEMEWIVDFLCSVFSITA